MLLIGIVKKNAIMMVDFALEAERQQGLGTREAIERACLLRFRPIMMTTFAALFGALPLAFGTGEGSELRHPLGITIVGGLIVSQVLTLYTTPVVFIYLDSFGKWLGRLWNRYYLRVNPTSARASAIALGWRASGAALVIAGALSGCAPVGPDFLRPAAIVSPQFKEIAGWKIATPRQSEPKGEWWSVFHDPELSRLESAVAISNQTVKADEANYREALALINEARAGLFPTINGNGSAVHSSPKTTTLTAEATGQWMLDVWGLVRREIEAQQAGAEVDAANLANALLAAQSALALAYVQLREADALEDLLTRTVVDYKHSLTITQNQYNAGTAAKSDVITAQTQVLNAQAPAHRRRRYTRPERACGRRADGPPAGGAFDSARRLGDQHSLDPGASAVLPARAEAGRRGGGGDDATGQRRDRRRLCRLFPDGLALRPLRLFGQIPSSAAIGPSNPVWSFGASLAQPLFNGGLTGAQVEAARQTYQADVATYRQTVLTAIQQVEDNLVGNSHPGARGQGSGGERAHFAAGDPDRAQRISGRNPGLHHSRHRRGAAAYGGRVPVGDTGADPDRRGQPYRRARRRLEPVEAARRGGGFRAAAGPAASVTMIGRSVAPPP